jgi:hypothetical protein
MAGERHTPGGDDHYLTDSTAAQSPNIKADQLSDMVTATHLTKYDPVVSTLFDETPNHSNPTAMSEDYMAKLALFNEELPKLRAKIPCRYEREPAGCTNLTCGYKHTKLLPNSKVEYKQWLKGGYLCKYANHPPMIGCKFGADNCPFDHRHEGEHCKYHPRCRQSKEDCLYYHEGDQYSAVFKGFTDEDEIKGDRDDEQIPAAYFEDLGINDKNRGSVWRDMRRALLNQLLGNGYNFNGIGARKRDRHEHYHDSWYNKRTRRNVDRDIATSYGNEGMAINASKYGTTDGHRYKGGANSNNDHGGFGDGALDCGAYINHRGDQTGLSHKCHTNDGGHQPGESGDPDVGFQIKGKGQTPNDKNATG